MNKEQKDKIIIKTIKELNNYCKNNNKSIGFDNNKNINKIVGNDYPQYN